MGTIQMQVQNSGIQATTQKGSAAVCKHRTTKKVAKITPASFNGDGCAQTSAVCTACGYTKVTSAAKIAKVSAPKLAKTVYTYNGKVQKPSVTVKDSTGKPLKAGADYTVNYPKGRKAVGRYGVLVKLKGKYKGSRTVYFTVKPKGTSISKVTGGKKKITVTWKKQTTQTTGYQIQYSTSSNFKNAKTVTVSKNSTTKKTITGLKNGKKYYVRVRTYKTVKTGHKSTKYYSNWSKSKKTGGAKKSAPKGNTVYVSPTGKKYHYIKSCAGKHPIKTTLKEAKKNHTPCKKCAM